jgi:alcohol dehydrogenase
MGTGRALFFVEPGRPLELIEAPVPEPNAGEMLVRVCCCTLCSSDWHTLVGRRTEPTPTVLGHEIVGVVAAFGPTASRHDIRGATLAVGDRITWAVAVGCGGCFFCTVGLSQKCERLTKYGHRQVSRDRPFLGGLADYVLLEPGTAILRLPPDVPDPAAAQAACAGATAAAVVRAGSPFVAGGTVLILGAGPLGLWATALARAGGAASVIVCDPDAGCRERAVQFGANAVMPPDKEAAAITTATEGRGADVVLDLAGSADAVFAAIRSARVGGTVILAGTVLPTAAVPLDPEMVVRRMLTIRGVHNYAPADLAVAVDFLAGPGRRLPFAELVGQTVRLADAATIARGEQGLRLAVVP